MVGGLLGSLGAALPLAMPRPLRAAMGAGVDWRLSPPVAAPDVGIVDLHGQRRPLVSYLAGQVTAVQLMFTGCSSVCPLQGALFAALAQAVDDGSVRLLSISIDALGDSPQSLQAWLGRFGRHRSWSGGIADAADVDRLSAFLRGHAVRPGTHSRQVFVFDRAARLAYRTEDDPAGLELARLLQELPLRA